MSLMLPQRVKVLREDLIRILDAHGAHNVRLVGRLARERRPRQPTCSSRAT